MKRISKLMLALLLSVALLLSACGSPSSEGDSSSDAGSSSESGGTADGASTKDTLTIRMQSDPGTVDISKGSITESMQILSMIANKLLVVKDDGTGAYVTVPDDQYSLASSYEYNEDNTVLIYNLKEGIKWHDGKDFTSADVVYSIKRNSSNSLYSYIDFDNITAPDEYTVHVGLHAPDAQAVINTSAMFICQDGTSEEDPTLFAENYIGTGAWKIDSWVPGDSITLSAFDDYFGGQPIINNIFIRFIDDASVSMMELQTGGIDIVDTPDWISVQSVMNGDFDGQIKYTSATDLYMHHLWFNCSLDNPFNDIDVRLAIMHGVDRDSLIYGAFEGIGETAYSIMSTTMGGVIDMEDSWPITYDVELAKEMLADAGYPDGFDATIINYGDQNDVLANEILKSQLAEIGINLTIESFDVATWVSIITEQPDDWDLALRLYGGINPMGRWTSVNIPQNIHVTPETHPDYAELYDLSVQSLRILDDEERSVIELDIQDRWFDEWAYTLPIHQKTQYNLFADNLMDVERYGYYWFLLDAYFA